MLIQQGARRNYVYAQQLERAGLLHTLATDAAWTDDAQWLLSPLLRKLAPRRRINGIPVDRIVTSVLPNVISALAKRTLHRERAFAIVDEALALVLTARNFVGVDVVVNYQGNGGSFLKRARARGAAIITDFIITPKNLELEFEERCRWPGWEKEDIGRPMIDFYSRRMSNLMDLSDIYLCPSSAVARDLATIDGYDPARARVVPYGVSGVLLKAGVIEPGRVLFAGAAGLRKGIHILAKAAMILKQRAPSISFIVAGEVTETIRNRAETRALTFLGKIGREAMAEEMARADVFCLPSLAEGSATSVFEALANGLPTVTTESTGTVVVSGVDGFIVPERDAVETARAIEAIVTDRSLRARMSQAARVTAAKYGDRECGDRFIAVVREVLEARDRALESPEDQNES